jgi:hypothetical protein
MGILIQNGDISVKLTTDTTVYSAIMPRHYTGSDVTTNLTMSLVYRSNNLIYHILINQFP